MMRLVQVLLTPMFSSKSIHKVLMGLSLKSRKTAKFNLTNWQHTPNMVHKP